MRKIKNHQFQSANPSLLFARGVEQLVSDQLYRPARNDRKEIEKMRREAKKQQSRGGFLNILLRPFTV